MDVTLAPTHPVMNRRTRRSRRAAGSAPAAPVATTAELARTLPLRVSAGVRVSAPNWMWIVGGGVVGALLLGPIGAIGGALAGVLLTR